MKDMMIGVDLAKNVLQVHGALRTGEILFRKKLTRKLGVRDRQGMLVVRAAPSSST